MKFIDLFSGLGGFHVALLNLGHKCVMACEIDSELRRIYMLNHGLEPVADIRSLDLSNVPDHDILCAGFPCQPFSKAGEQEGFECPKSGDLITYVLKIVALRKPSFLLLENVPNLLKHGEGSTWKRLCTKIERAGYTLDYRILSPHYFGIPQIRERVIIVASRKGLGSFSWPLYDKKSNTDIRTILDINPPGARPINPNRIRCLNVWQQFVALFPKNEEFPTHPIWAMEFGATYPYQEITPHVCDSDTLRKYRGSFGRALGISSYDSPMDGLPSHAKNRQEKFPDWKIEFIAKNRALYKKHKSWIDTWKTNVENFESSLQKLEWNCKGDARKIYEHMIQFRASGVRVKKPTTSPSLIACTTSQIPIVGWERRHMTTRECARLQSLDGLKHLPATDSRSFRALGNAVNAKLIEAVAARLIQNSKSA